MATATFAFDTTEGSPATSFRNNGKRTNEVGPEFLSIQDHTIIPSNGKSKHQEVLHEFGSRDKTPIDLPPKPLIRSEYGDSEGPIYHQANGDRGIYHPSWDARKSDQLSLINIVGIRDVCGNKKLWRMLLAEFIGTLFLVLIGCGSCLKGWNPTYEPGVVQIALAFGVTVATMAQAIGHVSGCHINPAVTVGLVAAGQCSLLKAICYIIFQCLGAICGAAILQTVTPEEMQGNLGITLLHSKLEPVQGLFVEALVTFVLVLTVCGVGDNLRKDIKGSAPLAIGLSISVCHLMAIQYSGCGMNPARTLGPAVLTKNWTHHWVYWAGPMMGGFCAGFLYQISFKERVSDDTLCPEPLDKSRSRS